MRGWTRGVTAAALLAAAAGARGAVEPDEYAELAREIASSRAWDAARLEREAERREALILPGDRTPCDVALRRTEALLRHLRALADAPELSEESAQLEALRARAPEAGEAEERARFASVAALRRRVAFKNPLLAFDRIAFLKHNKQARGERHMVDQYFGFNAERAGGVYVLERPFGPAPVARSLLEGVRVANGRLKGLALENAGGFVGLELDWDARRLLFAFTEAEHELPPGVACDTNYWTEADAARDPKHRFYHFRPETCYHLFAFDLESRVLTQLTDGAWNDFDGCFLPGGRIAFVSTRAGGQLRCGLRPDPTYTLHAMEADGGDIVRLSYHDTNEWHPSVDPSGMLLYTRWDYVDRDSDVAHHLWHCFPDGRDPRSYHGNYPDRREARPWMELSARAVPGSQRVVAVAAPHHGEAYGSLVLIDLRERDDRAMGQLKRLTPEVLFPESESAPGVPHAKGRHAPLAEVYGTPWPLSEEFYLVVRDAGCRTYGLYLLDCFGNRELLYRDPSLACLDPIPLRPRPRPPALPAQTAQAQRDRRAGAETGFATVLVKNAYESELPWPAGARIERLRVMALFPKENSVADEPRIGLAAQSLCRGSLGTVPVEADGSAHFRAPVGTGLYFQALDGRGMAVQTMRSATYLHAGETLTCVGCHEAKRAASGRADGRRPDALQRAPSELRPEPEGSFPLAFPRLVQPVLDARCVACHEASRGRGAPGLRGDRFGECGWSEAFASLRTRAWGMSGGNGVALKERQYSVPGEVGARASRLYRLLEAGHHDVRLSGEELLRITLWLDGNSNFYGAYSELARQARGAAVRPRFGLPEGTPFERWAR